MDPTRLLPHAPPMRLLRRVDEVDPERVLAVGTIPDDAPGAFDGTAPAILGIEIGAQATAMIAAAQLVERDPAAEPRIGYLVSLRSVTLHVGRLPVGVELTVEARRKGGAGGLELFEVVVRLPGSADPVVEGTVGTMLRAPAGSPGDSPPPPGAAPA